MIKAEGKFSQVKMEKLLRHSAIHVEPMFSIAPEAFDAVQVVSAFGSPQLFSDHDLLASDGQASLSVPGISVVKTARSGMFDDQAFYRPPITPPNREHSDYTVALKDAEHNHFTCGPPAPFTFPMAAKHRLIALDGPSERSGATLSDAQDLADHAKELFHRGKRSRATKAKAVSWHAEHEIIDQLQLGAIRQTHCLPGCAKTVIAMTAAALETTVG